MLTPNNMTSHNYSAAAYLAWTDATGTPKTFYPDLVLSEEWNNSATGTEHPVEQGANVIDHVRVELVKCKLVIFATNEPVGDNTMGSPGSPQTVALTGNAPSDTEGTYPVGSVQASVWDSNSTARGIALAAGDLAATAAAAAIGGIGGGLAGEAAILGAGVLEGMLLAGSAKHQSVSVVAGSPPVEQASGTASVQLWGLTKDFVQWQIQQLLYLKTTCQIVSLIGSKQSMPTMFIENVSYTRSEEEGTGAEITLSLTEVRFVQTQVVTVPIPSVPSAASTVAKGVQNPSDAGAKPQQSVASWLSSLIAGNTPSTSPVPGP